MEGKVKNPDPDSIPGKVFCSSEIGDDGRWIRIVRFGEDITVTV
jgi:hypothetical protein